MKNKVLWGLAVLPALITTAVLPFMADSVPMHYDAAGTIDRWGSKYEHYIFPIIILVMALFWYCFLLYFRKKQIKAGTEKEREEAKNNEKVIYAVSVGQIVMFGIMHCFFLYTAFVEMQKNLSHMAIDSGVVLNVLLAAFMVIIGNILPKTKRNSVAGVRTVWSMESDETWAESNRFGGVTCIVSGILIFIEAMLVGGLASTFIMLGILLLWGVACVWYSYRAYRKYKRKMAGK